LVPVPFTYLPRPEKKKEKKKKGERAQQLLKGEKDANGFLSLRAPGYCREEEKGEEERIEEELEGKEK